MRAAWLRFAALRLRVAAAFLPAAARLRCSVVVAICVLLTPFDLVIRSKFDS